MRVASIVSHAAVGCAAAVATCLVTSGRIGVPPSKPATVLEPQ
jgi:hypothetical protein